MNTEADVEVTLASGADAPVSPVRSFGFIVSFGAESFSAAVLPTGSAALVVGSPVRVRLHFLVPEAAPYLSPGTSFTFFEGARRGSGHVV